jgi:hypothetical protein
MHDPRFDFGYPLGERHLVKITLQVRDSDVREMLKQDRLLQRHLLAGKVVAVLVALMAAVAAYLRLEDLTRGYYTRPLRAALGACVVVIGLGLWWVW